MFIVRQAAGRLGEHNSEYLLGILSVAAWPSHALPAASVYLTSLSQALCGCCVATPNRRKFLLVPPQAGPRQLLLSACFPSWSLPHLLYALRNSMSIAALYLWPSPQRRKRKRKSLANLCLGSPVPLTPFCNCALTCSKASSSPCHYLLFLPQQTEQCHSLHCGMMVTWTEQDYPVLVTRDRSFDLVSFRRHPLLVLTS